MDDWDADFEFQKLIARSLSDKVVSLPVRPREKDYSATDLISPEDWQKVMKVGAAIVERHGMRYSGLFERAEQEYQQAVDRQLLEARIKQFRVDKK